MLILMRRPGESIYIGQQVKVTVISTKGNQVRFGFDAPKGVKIDREEIYERNKRQQEEASEDEK